MAVVDDELDEPELTVSEQPSEVELLDEDDVPGSDDVPVGSPEETDATIPVLVVNATPVDVVSGSGPVLPLVAVTGMVMLDGSVLDESSLPLGGVPSVSTPVVPVPSVAVPDDVAATSPQPTANAATAMLASAGGRPITP